MGGLSTGFAVHLVIPCRPRRRRAAWIGRSVASVTLSVCLSVSIHALTVSTGKSSASNILLCNNASVIT